MLDAAVSNCAVRDGYVVLPLHREGDFLDRVGPILMKDEQGALVIGTEVARRHCNVAGSCHGGFLLAFADTLLPLATQYQEAIDDYMLTVQLTGDFLAPAPLGSWLEGRATLVKATGNLFFTQGLISADGAPVLRCNGIFKRGLKTNTVVGGDLFAELR
jgi:uncharacterized protein (TIGR00369 family)